MRIGLFHGYELSGSGSNEYTHYLAHALHEQGHTVHVICKEYAPEKFPYFNTVTAWNEKGVPEIIRSKEPNGASCYLHQLPKGDIYPVYLTDKQREGNVRSFINMTDDELHNFKSLNARVLRSIIENNSLDILHCNHVVYQPEIAREVCKDLNVPFVVYPHGSAIEYTVKLDERFKVAAQRGLRDAQGIIVGNQEMARRLHKIYPEDKDAFDAKLNMVGVGVDTSLFNPVSKENRAKAISKLKFQGLGGGKKLELSQKLKVELDQGNVSAVRKYASRYDQKLPDESVAEKLGALDWQNPTLLFAGALTVAKGIQTLIAGLPGIIKEVPNAQAVIVGSGAYRETLEALVHAIETRNLKLLRELCARGFDLDRNDLTGPWEDVEKYINDIDNIETLFEYGQNLSERIVFTGYMQHETLKHVFPCASLAVFPSVLPEAYPLVLMEALSNGVIPVVSDFRGFRCGLNDLTEFLEPEIHSNMKIPMDPRIRMVSFIEHVTTLLKNPKVETLQSYLHEVAVNNYDWSLRAGQMVEAYEKCLQNPKSNGNGKRVA